jgi:hypothetical protein
MPANDDRVGVQVADPDAGVTAHVFPDGAQYEVKDGVTVKCVRSADQAEAAASEQQ